MAGLPKKYAKMGFKEGWKAYKSQHKKSKPATKNKRVEKHMAHKKWSAFQAGKGLVYVGAVTVPGAIGFQQLQNTYGLTNKQALIATGQAYLGINHGTNKFDWATLGQMWTPTGIVIAGDIITSKFGIQKRFSRAINAIFG